MHKHTIVKFIEPVNDGMEFDLTDWPLHITLADDFELELTRSDVAAHLQRFAANQDAVKVVAESDGYLGKYSQIQVTFVDTNPDLFRLHKDLVAVLKKCGAVFYNPHYIIGGYKPHVTVQRSARVHPGDVVIVDQLSIVDMQPDGNPNRRRIIKSIKFGNPASS